MRKIAFLLILISFQISCDNSKNIKLETEKQIKIIAQTSEPPATKTNTTQKKEIKKPNFIDDSLQFNGYLGIIVLEDNFYKDTISILNLDGSEYLKLWFGGETQEFYDQLQQKVEKLDIFAYHPDYSLFQLEANLNDSSYIFSVNDGTLKQIMKSNIDFTHGNNT